MREKGTEKHIWLQHQGEKAQQITKGTQWHLYPDISQDGKQMTWVEGENDSTLSLVTYQVDDKSKEIWKLNANGLILHPQFSSNAHYIFYSAPNGKGENKIFYFSPKEKRSELAFTREGEHKTYFLSNPIQLKHNGSGYFPRPVPNGDKIIFQRNSQGQREIVEYDLKSHEQKVIAQGMSPQVSFDGKFAVYTSKKEGTWDVYLYDRTLGKSFPLTKGGSDEMAPSFNHKNQVTYASNKSGKFQLYHLKDGNEELLSEDNQSDDYAPQFSGREDLKQSMSFAIPSPLRSSFGSVVHKGKLYICGGHQGAEHTYPPESFTNTVHVYDIKSKSWSELAPKINKAHGFQMAAYGDYLYAFGGFAFNESTKPQWKSLDTIERYDIKKNKWEVIGRMPRSRSSNVAVTIDEKVYLIGGWDSTPQSENDYEGRFHHKVDIFDLKSEAISEANFDIPQPLRRAFTATEYNGNIILIGGLGIGSTHFELINKVSEINPTTGFTRELPILPFATFAPAAEVIGHELFVFGGMFKTGEMNYEYVSHIYALDLQKFSWRHTGRYLFEPKGFSQVVRLKKDTLGVLGGHRYFDGYDSPVNTFEIFSL